MKRLILVTTFLALVAGSVMAADKKTAQEKVWTDDYQYGLKEGEKPKTGKPSEGGEFEIAPKK